MKVFLSGVAGFIGFHVAKKLLQNGFFVIGIDNLDDYYSTKLKKDRLKILRSYKNFKFYKLDLNDLEKANFSEIEIAINLAAQPGVRLPLNKYFKYDVSNKNGYVSFLDFCKNNHVKKIIYASSSSVYSCVKKIPYNERTLIKTTKNKYAETKLFNEKISSKFSKKYDLKIIGLRFFTVYGEFGRPDMAYYKFINDILNDKEIRLFNNGKTARDMTYIDDIVRGVLKSIHYFKDNNFNHEIFNLGNDNPVPTIKLISLIESEFNKKALITFEKKITEVSCTHADITKSKECLKYHPKTDIKEGLKIFFSWYKSYHKL